eukprot:TRINITY_DN200_c0_g1_i2.p1 TRINITY_DN200_c0_g1~~TRINITY_DN200_c0_g1_i2.p1  ORF type:complete len:270 (+),score=64.79 TRINITY_DN200_c0_g1_i2:678-1487(+)
MTFSSEGTNYVLFTHSYEGYGMSSTQQTQQGLLKNAGNVVHDPCLFEGFTQTKVINGQSVNVIGDGNYQQCVDNIILVLNDTKSCDQIVPKGWFCGFDGVIQPLDWGFSNSFFAWGLFADTIMPMQLGNTPTVLDIQHFSNNLCNETWADVQSKYGAALSNDQLVNFCFDATYVATLIDHGYRLPAHSHNVTFTNTIAGNPIAWALGCMVYEANLLPESVSTMSLVDSSEGLVLISVALSLILMSAVTIAWFWWSGQRVNQQNLYVQVQ